MVCGRAGMASHQVIREISMISAPPPTSADRLAMAYDRMHKSLNRWADAPRGSHRTEEVRWNILMAAANELAYTLDQHCEPAIEKDLES